MRYVKGIIYCVLLFTFCSCQTVITNDSISDLYFIGGIEDDDKVLNPGYYKNNSWVELETLSNSIFGLASFMTVIGNDVYVSGVSFINQDGPLPCLWINGKLNLLSLPEKCKYAFAYDIITLNNDLIIAGTINGFSNQFPGYWKNDKFIYLCLAPNTYEGMTNAICSMNNDIYFAGFCSIRLNINIPGYWKNSKWFALPVLNNNYENVYVHDIKSINNKVIVSGSCIDENYRNVPCYWYNNKLCILTLPDDYLESIPNNIFIHKSDIYIAGYYIDRSKNYVPGYWKNNEWNQLENSNTMRRLKALDIGIKDNEVYVVGDYLTKDGDLLSCIWVNGKLQLSTDYSDKMLVLSVFGK